jgi:tyrosyl-tRNA synthetase
LPGSELNDAKKILADEATTLCHGAAAALTAAETARQTFEEGKVGDALPTVEVARADLDAGLWVVEALRQAGLVSSNGEARRLIKNNGARVNDTAVHDVDLKLGPDDVSAEGLIKLSVGRKRHALLRVA